ncbi:GumC family protein [Oricola indica]|jgi:exopolysaccharide transport family protein|uniref:GumC family protein n=1 Tax=Oricola indica TaxID=2872591 RepID=UPI001CBCBF91|nr:Wzz/FepE/Etk N-terminal domain-containing protein [Oricola indica]
MSRVDYATRDADIDIGRLFGALWRDRIRILLGALVITGLVFVGLSLMTPKYMSDARLLIESGESVFTRPGSDNAGSADSPLPDPEGVASQVEILTSSDLLMQVADDLALEQYDEFNPDGLFSGLKAGLAALGLMEDPSQVTPEKRILDAVRNRLDVYAVTNSRVVVIEFQSTDKELAAKFANALAQAYLALESRAQLETTGKAANYLADEIADLQDSVRKAEAAVADYRASSGLFIGQNNNVLATQQLAELTTELSRVRAERSGAEARARSVRAALDAGASVDSLPDVVQSALIGRLREREIALQSEIADLSATLLPEHPRIQGLRSQLRDLSRQIDSEVRKVLAGLRSEAEIARSREQEVLAEVSRLKAASVDASESEVELRALEREAASQRDLLESYLVRFREARSRDEGQYAPAKARLISRAVVSNEAAFPKVIPLTGAAFFVSLLIMMLVTLVRELFSGRAFVPVSVAVPPEQPAVAMAPPVSEDDTPAEVEVETIPEPVMEQAPEPPAASLVEDEPVSDDKYGIEALAISLVEARADRAIIVSPEGDAGAAASVALARMLAGEGLRTVVVDLSGTGAATRRMLEDADCPGITDLLAASSSYSDVIYPDYATGAHIIPTGIADPARAMRAADRLPIILDALVSAYDMVIVECGPTNAEGLRRLAGAGSRIVLAVSDPAAPEIVETAEDLVDAGYDDLLLVTTDEEDESPVDPQSRSAYAR